MPNRAAGLGIASDPAMSTWVRAGLRLFRALAIAYLLALVVLMFFEERMIFIPSRYPEGDWRPRGLAVEDAWFRADDGVELHGWYVAAQRPRAVVLFCHGNAGNVTHRAEALRALCDVVGVSTLVFDYRGYGRSRGKPDEAGVLADARARGGGLPSAQSAPGTDRADGRVARRRGGRIHGRRESGAAH